MSTTAERTLHKKIRKSAADQSVQGEGRYDRQLVKNPLVHNLDVIRHVIRCAGGNTYLSLAILSIQWKDAWGDLPKTTSRTWAVQSCSCLDWAKTCGLSVWDNPCVRAAAEGRLDVLKRAVSLGYTREGMSICELAAERGHLEVVRWCRSNGYPWGQSCVRAAERGHLEVLRWCKANGCPWGVETSEAPAEKGQRDGVDRWSWQYSSLKYRACVRVITAAVGRGQLNIVRWCREQGCPWPPKACFMAARGGHFELLRWLRAEGCSWCSDTMAGAVKAGRLEMLKWCVANRCPWSGSIIRLVAERGKLDMAMWCVANLPVHNWGTGSCATAAGNGHLEMVRWLRARGCPWGQSVCYAAACGGHLEVLKWCVANGCPWEDTRWVWKWQFQGSVAMMLWAVAERCPWASSRYDLDNIYEHAAEAGNLEVMKWCRTLCDSFDSSGAALVAASKGHLHVLKWMQESGDFAEGRETLCETVAYKGFTQALRWCREHDFPWDEATCAAAAGGGHLGILRWCRNNGCPWDKETAERAAEYGHLEILAWCRANGCPWSRSVPRRAARMGNVEILAWCRANGCVETGGFRIETVGCSPQESRERLLLRQLPRGFHPSQEQYG